MATIKNVLFDFGGVIVDLDREAAIGQFKKIGLDSVEEYLDPYRQRGFFSEFERGHINTEQFYDNVRELVRKDVFDKDLFDKEIDRGWLAFLKPIDPARLQFILDLHGSYRTYLLSNTNPIVMRWADSSDFTPARLPLRSYFNDLYLSYELGCLKPEPEIFRKFIELSGVTPEETLYIDDSAENIEAGASFGFQTMLYGSNSSFEDIRRELELASGKP
ncbi:MAG: HAD family phosphatase [Prevotellaceae bacterium]|jgi:putative hydrolase of the HAD superfamily|nr:HAD family phosphatase [Prevotellaceae bacterium]